jgi:mannose-6-phosphate isomerase class I
MFNPFPFDDYSAVNIPEWSNVSDVCVTEGNFPVVTTIADALLQKQKEGKVVFILDGYVTASFEPFVNLLSRMLIQGGCDAITAVPIIDAYKDSDTLEDQFSEYLPMDTVEDPVLMYGKLFHGNEEAFFDKKRMDSLIQKIASEDSGRIVIVYGNFASTLRIRALSHMIAYIDLIPKNVVLRFKGGKCRNIGDEAIRNYGLTMRRAYYIDLEIALKCRSDLLSSSKLDWYISGDDDDFLKMVPFATLRRACDALAHQPFRCKPVYNEGVWGGYHTMAYRNLPEKMKNCAWVFDLIPSEVSLLVKIGASLLDIPFYTFIRMESLPLLGKRSIDHFGQYFPIRFNYDDTIRSNGNMSVQVHPGEQYIKEHFDEIGRQDESYYIVAVGPDAVTYCGFNEAADPDEFLDKVSQSELDSSEIDYKKYIHAEKSEPGKQFMLPAGTIHASGRNQLVLEIGSLTVGSYTFKLYDYLREDIDGKPRPIHSVHGRKVLEKSRTSAWVRKNLVQEPQEVDSGEGWRELVLGEHDLMYFTLRRLEFIDQAVQDTKGTFHVLSLVDGESVIVGSIEHPSRQFEMKFMDIIVVPASIGPYWIKNLGTQPVSIHKTLLKEDF